MPKILMQIVCVCLYAYLAHVYGYITMTLAFPIFYFLYLMSVEGYRLFKLSRINSSSNRQSVAKGGIALAKQVNDRYCLITGGSSGIGLELSKLFALDGARLLIVSFEPEEVLNKVATMLRELGSPEVVCFRLDLTKENAIDELYDNVKQCDISILIHNAGFGAVGPTLEISQGRTLGMIDLHNKALVRLYYKFLPDLLKRQKSRKEAGEAPVVLMNTSSIVSFRAIPRFNGYAASKAYVRWFSEGVRGEISHTGIRLMLLCPGATSTAFVKDSGFDGTRQATMPGATTSPEYVARYAYYSLFCTSSLMAIPGFINWALYYVSPFVPEALWHAYMNMQMS